MTPLLKKNDLTLKPFKDDRDYQYLLSLAVKDKYACHSASILKDNLYRSIYFAWNSMLNDTNCGVVFVNKVKDYGFTLDGYRNEELYRKVCKGRSISLESGEMVTKFMFNNHTNIMRSIHNVENRPADVLCKRLGYNLIATIKKYGQSLNVFEKRR